MDTININTISKVQKETIIEVSFQCIKRISILNAGTIRERLSQLLTTPKTVVYLNLNGINFIDSYGFETLNKVSRIAKKNNSRIILVEVSEGLNELIDLVRNNSIFEIDQVIEPIKESNVA